MALPYRASIPALMTAVATACGAPAPSTSLSASGADQAPIVGGSRDPINVQLTAGQVLAIGYLADPEGFPFCSATLVRRRIILTAHHCVVGETPSSLEFGIGTDPSAPLARIPIEAIHSHPSIDFAALVLGLDATTQVSGITPLAMNRTPMNAAWVGRWIDSAGYGQTHTAATGRFFASEQLVGFDSTTVTVDGHGVDGICFGDSGGPILWQANSTSQVIIVGTEQWGDVSCVGQDHLARVDVVAPWVDGLVAAGLPPVLQPCGDVNYYGQCTADVAQWCGAGYLRSQDCAALAEHCGWMGADVGYACVPTACGQIDGRGICDSNTRVYCSSSGGLAREDCSQSSQRCIDDNATTGAHCGDCFRCNGVCTDIADTEQDCGGCGIRCAPANAIGVCRLAHCEIASCDTGFVDADGNVEDGCEKATGRDPTPRRHGCAAVVPSSPVALLALAGLLLGRRRLSSRRSDIS